MKLKGLILAGGEGTRLRPITYTSAKQLVPVANKPVLFYGIEALVEAGITELGMIVAPKTAEEIEAAVGDGGAFGAAVTYIPQERPLGLAHAVATAQPFLGEDPFVMYLGDNLLQGGIVPLVRRFVERRPDALILLTAVEDPQNYGVAELAPDSPAEAPVIRRLVEKPKDPPSNLALVGVYMFTAKIHRAVGEIKPSARGELEITDAIQRLIDDGARVEAQTVEGWWKDTGQLEDMLEANRLVLDNLHGKLEGSIEQTILEGRVAIEVGATVVESRLRGPVIVGAGAEIRRCYIGPYTAIGPSCRLEEAELEHSIVLEGAVVRRPGGRIESSLLGRGARIERGERQPRALRFMVGDNSAVWLP